MRNSNEKGFTLIEILIVIVLLAIVSALFYNAYFDSTRTLLFNKNRIELQRAQDLTNRWLSRYIRIADVPSDFNSMIINDGNVLEFSTVSDPANDIRFYLDNNNLYISIDGNARQICDCKFENISFNANSSLNVIEFYAEITIDENRVSYQFNNIFYPRVQN
ncbi:PulJ/GspJ family protein [Halanaerobium hydrogeniformans]|uniref:Prepilin-type N-terminal cleavage/methylation domain-containing protein n=1 Tax=Halanaerobium hydrogeniformans TaxID=656519 RepID=E4RLF1_HALHG|nr:prepilin-type N-terminal cleavage/methylation domain-containing protein [Halanaerobium hydrogeniformans]ADQ14865.1 hypothetical protein Halsa_1438 [Halanaerobium hydrogeniformans]